MTEPHIPFIRYSLPDGRRSRVEMACSPEAAQRAQEIIAQGFVFEVEVLSSGNVSTTITDPQRGDFDITIGANGPDVTRNVEAMVKRFDDRQAAMWKRRRA
jgi:hypothetical protein